MDLKSMLPEGTLLRNGTYRIEKHLSSGGFANTYLVRNVAFNELYALKEFFMKGINMRSGHDVTVSVPDNNITYESQMDKFRKEALRLRRLNNPHIVQVHDLFQENGTAYYVMDYIDGESVGAYMKRTGETFPEAKVWKLLMQMLDALQAVHDQGLWHLDIKPGNIMFDKRGIYYLIDFGASKQMHASDSNSVTSSALCYTPGYAPMEQVEQAVDKFGPWTDFYALGATFYYMLTRQQPPSFTALSEEGAFQLPSTVSPRLSQLIRWMMKPNRKDRPQSVADIRGYVAEHSAGQPLTSVPDDDDDAETEMLGAPAQTPPQEAKDGKKAAKTEKKVAKAEKAKKKPQQPEPAEEEEKPVVRKRFRWWMALLLFLLAAGIGGGVYYYYNPDVFDNIFSSGSSSDEYAVEEQYDELYDRCAEKIKNAEDWSDMRQAEDMLQRLKTMEEENDLDVKSDKLRKRYDEMSEKLAANLGYMEIREVKFSNIEQNGAEIEPEGSVLYAARIKYLCPHIYYVPYSTRQQEVEFQLKITKPDGDIVSGNNSPSGYSYTCKRTLKAADGSNEPVEVKLIGWGSESNSTYQADTEYTFEVFVNNRLLHKTTFKVF